MQHLVWSRLVTVGVLAAPISGRAQAPQPKVQEIATLPGVDYVDQAVLLPNRRIIVYATNDSIFSYNRTSQHTTFITPHSGGDWRFGAVSPQGDRIAYRRQGEDGKGHFLWSIPIDPASGKPTGPAQRVTTGEAENPGFSPDGRLLAYAAGAESKVLAVVPATGGVERVVASYARRLSPPTWSADGRWIFVAVGESPDTLISIERAPAAGGRSEALLWFPRSARPWDGGSWGFIEGRLALYRPDSRAQLEGRLAYVSPSGARGEITLPHAASVSDGGAAVRVLMTVTTRLTSAHLLNLADGTVRDLGSAADSQTSAVAFSPDGRRIALQRGTRDRLELMTMNVDGSAPRRFPIQMYAERRRVDWSPDGGMLAYYADAGASKLAVLHLDTGATQLVASVPANMTIQNFIWRSDSKSLLLVKQAVNGTNQLVEARLDGTERLLRDLSVEVPGFNPGGGFATDQSLVMGSRSWKVTVVPTSGGAPHEISGTEHRLSWPGVSNDGKWLLWQIRNTDGTITSLQLMTTTGDSVRTLNLPFTVDRRFPFSAISPDVRQAVLVGVTAGDTTAKLFLVPLDGQAPRMLGRLSNRVVGRVSFSPDGRTLLYNTWSPPTARLYELDLSPVLQAVGKP